MSDREELEQELRVLRVSLSISCVVMILSVAFSIHVASQSPRDRSIEPLPSTPVDPGSITDELVVFQFPPAPTLMASRPEAGARVPQDLASFSTHWVLRE